VQVVVERVEVLAGVLLAVPVKVEAELLTRLHDLLLALVVTLAAIVTHRTEQRNTA
jgi:hypothetical protein